MNLLNEKQLSDELGIASNTLRKWRWEGKGPKFLKLGGRVAYSREDIDEYLRNAVCTSTSQATA